MTRPPRPVGIEVPGERELAGHAVGWMYLLGTVVSFVLPLLPGVPGELLTATTPLAGVSVGLGYVALRRVDWRHAPGWVAHAALLLGAVMIAAVCSDNGGAQSPARFLLLMVVVYSSYFFPAREAWLYVPVTLVIHAVPFLYDPHALAGGLLPELVMVTLCYSVVAGSLIRGKRSMLGLQAEADALARRDPLTGLANRRALVEAMDTRRRLGLLLLDIDDFKAVNTRFGHPGGDRALAEVADCLRGAVRGEDLPARLGGDEFAVLVHEASRAGMAALATRVLEAVRETGSVRVSAGWACGDADTLLIAADEALAEAKLAGKDRALSAQYVTAAR